MTLFLDACVIIYWVEAAEPFYSTVTSAIRKLAGASKPKFAISRLSFLECRVRPLRDRHTKLLARYGQFFKAPDLQVAELSPEVIAVATELRAEYRLRTPDALQAASALCFKEPTIFITGDAAFKKIPHLHVHCL